MITLDILALAFICTFVVDLTGFVEELGHGLGRILGIPPVRIPKPFSCSLCMTWWCGVLWVWAHGSLTLCNLCIVAGAALITPEIAGAVWFVKSKLQKLLK